MLCFECEEDLCQAHAAVKATDHLTIHPAFVAILDRVVQIENALKMARAPDVKVETADFSSESTEEVRRRIEAMTASPDDLHEHVEKSLDFWLITPTLKEVAGLWAMAKQTVLDINSGQLLIDESEKGKYMRNCAVLEELHRRMRDDGEIPAGWNSWRHYGEWLKAELETVKFRTGYGEAEPVGV